MTTDFRALCAELAEQLDDSLDFTVSGETRRHMKLLTRRARAALADELTAPTPPAALPEGYIDPEHSGDDRALLETYYAACQAEGGTADDITLRGLRAVLASRANDHSEGVRQSVREAIAEAIGNGAYDCLRVWEAWGVGTMGEDDFAPIVESDERIAEIADAAIDAMRRAAPAPPADTHYEWELEDAHGEWQAGGSSNSQSDVEREGMRYLQSYAPAPHKLIIRQHTTQTINEITNG